MEEKEQPEHDLVGSSLSSESTDEYFRERPSTHRPSAIVTPQRRSLSPILPSLSIKESLAVSAFSSVSEADSEESPLALSLEAIETELHTQLSSGGALKQPQQQPLPFTPCLSVSHNSIEISDRSIPSTTALSDNNSIGSSERSVASPTRNRSRSTVNRIATTSSALLKSIDIMDMAACSCCRQPLDDASSEEQRQSPSKQQQQRSAGTLRQQRQDQNATTRDEKKKSRDIASLITAAESVDDEDTAPELMTGVLGPGINYTITKILVEGMLQKKGTGQDWLGSRGWKARWARLALGYVEGYGPVTVPLLCISWYPNSTASSTVIILDSTVVMAVDLPNKRDNQFRFDIKHAATRENSSLPVTRTFSASSRRARDAWVLAMSQALLKYEKQKAAVRKRMNRRLSFPKDGNYERWSSEQKTQCDELERTTVEAPLAVTFRKQLDRPASSQTNNNSIARMAMMRSSSSPPLRPRYSVAAAVTVKNGNKSGSGSNTSP